MCSSMPASGRNQIGNLKYWNKILKGLNYENNTIKPPVPVFGYFKMAPNAISSNAQGKPRQ